LLDGRNIPTAAILGPTADHAAMPADDVCYSAYYSRFWRAELGRK
jgi:hypothetical protein